MKALPLTEVPAAVVMLILPVFAPAGTVAVIFVSETTLKPALTPPILTAVAPRRFVPVIVTFAPAFAFAGVTCAIDAFAAAPVAFTVTTVCRPQHGTTVKRLF